MARITKNLASKTDNFKLIDEQYAYMVFIAEKEFNVGRIESDFPMMKLWNLFDEKNIKKYNDSGKVDKVDGKKSYQTLG